MPEIIKQAECRGCGMKLKGKDYMYGESAYHPVTNERCAVNNYGGFVCSSECDYKSSISLERTMPGHKLSDTRLSDSAKRSYCTNWPEE